MLLPAPVGPTTATTLPPRASNVTSCSTGLAGSYPKLTCSNRTAPGPAGNGRASSRSGTPGGAVSTSCSRRADTIAFWYCSLIVPTCCSLPRIVPIAVARMMNPPACMWPDSTATPPSRNSDRWLPPPMARMIGVKSANSLIRRIVRSKNVSQELPYLPISCPSVANALITWTPAMFSVSTDIVRSPASITALLAGWTFLPKRTMYHVHSGSGTKAASASHGLMPAAIM